jgi:methyltransferase (TIGR00027 family)
MESNFEKVGRTAFVIAEWRSDETESPSPLFSDHIANIFLNEETQKAAEDIAEVSPSTKHLVRYRTKYFDDAIMNQIKIGTRQIVNLGSGLDTRAIRFGSNDVKFFEVDQEHVLEYKREQLNKYGYWPNSSFIPCDYTQVDFLKLLEAKGFDYTLSTYFLWEGNVFYLPYENITTVLNSIRIKMANFKISFDYLSKKLIHVSTGFRKSEKLLTGFSKLGAPWNTGIEDIYNLAKDVEMAVDDNFLVAEYINNCKFEFELDTNLFDDYSICIFKK